MKQGLKVILSAVIPMAALVATSCSGAKNVSFDEAFQYAVDHFDEYSLDAIPVDYTFKMNELGANLDIGIIDEKGMTQDIKVTVGLSGITALARNLYAYCLSSAMLTKIHSNYATITSLVLENLTASPFNLSYDLINGGGMKISVGTDSLARGVADIIRAAVAALTTLSYMPKETRDGLIISMFGSSSDTDTKTKDLLLDLTAEVIARSLAKEEEEKSFDLAEKIIMVVDVMADGLLVSVDPTSTSMNDEFNVMLASESHGYLTSYTLNIASDLDIGIILDGDEQFPVLHPEFAGFDGRYIIKGHVGMNFSASAEFVK